MVLKYVARGALLEDACDPTPDQSVFSLLLAPPQSKWSGLSLVLVIGNVCASDCLAFGLRSRDVLPARSLSALLAIGPALCAGMLSNADLMLGGCPLCAMTVVVCACAR